MDQNENRENIYTQFARKIDDFVGHKITKVDLYNSFVAMVEMSDEDERKDRMTYHEKMAELTKDCQIIDSRKIPYSNWKEGLNRVEK